MNQQYQSPMCIGRYKITGRLGAGGMSLVYSAVASDIEGEIALKVTPLDNDINVDVTNYQLEVMMGREISHPAVNTPFDHGVTDTHAYLALPLIDGATLSNVTRLRDPLRRPSSESSPAWDDAWAEDMIDGQWQQVASIGVQLSHAVRACHRAGIIHRDIKPANVMMTRTGEVFLNDLGLAWWRDGPDQELETKAGTSRYLPPEIFQGQRDERSDIYSLGITMHELATGRKLWGEISHEDMREQRPFVRVPTVRSIRADVPEVLADCIDKASSESPADRHQTADELLEHFELVAESLNPPADAEQTKQPHNFAVQPSLEFRL